MNQSLLSIVRHVLTTIGAVLATKGTIAETDVEFYVGAVMTVLATIWGVIDKIEKDRAAKAAAKIVPVVLVSALMFCSGCKILPGNDSVVVRAEQSTAMGIEVFDAFVLWEYRNRDVLGEDSEVTKAANYIRANAPMWLSMARATTKAYKNNRTAENKADLLTAVKTLEAGIDACKDMLSKQDGGEQ